MKDGGEKVLKLRTRRVLNAKSLLWEDKVANVLREKNLYERLDSVLVNSLFFCCHFWHRCNYVNVNSKFILRQRKAKWFSG